MQEMAIRILLHAIRSAAAPLGRTMQPLISVYMDFYVRVFVRIWPNRAGALQACAASGLSPFTAALAPLTTA